MDVMAFLLQQADFDQLLVNLRMDAVFVKENMRVPWASEAGLVENIQQVIKEYKDSRGLQVCTPELINNLFEVLFFSSLFSSTLLAFPREGTAS